MNGGLGYCDKYIKMARGGWTKSLSAWARIATSGPGISKPRRRAFPLPAYKPHVSKKHEIAIAAIFRDESNYLREWLEFHLMVGVDRFILYDNDSRDNFREILEPYVAGGTVTLLPWVGFSPDPQILAYAHATRNCPPKVRWLAFLDVDEFLFSEASFSIKPVLEKFDEYAALIVPRFEFGPNGHKEEPEGLVIDNFTAVASRRVTRMKVKTVLNPDLAVEVAIHKSAVSGKVLKISDSDPADLRLNHYFSKSEAAFARKIRRGYDWYAEGSEIAWKKKFALLDAVSNESSEYSMSRFAYSLKMRLAAAGGEPLLRNLQTK